MNTSARCSRLAVLIGILILAGVATGASSQAPIDPASNSGLLFTETNNLSNNLIEMFARAPTGALTQVGSFSTQGTGTGLPLESQGAVALNAAHTYCYAVNAGSDDVTAFSVEPNGLTFINRISSGGTGPNSLTIHGDLVYVLNAQGTPNITGFRIAANGSLSALPGAAAPLSGGNSGGAEVSFNPAGTLLVVSERGTSYLDTYNLDQGIPSAPLIQPSNGPGPYGFAFDNHGYLIVSEVVNSSVSSYTVSPAGVLSVITGSLIDFGKAACWIVNTNNSHFASQYSYTTNTPSGTISGFKIGSGGSLTLLDSNGITAQLPVKSEPLDMTVDMTSNYLYVLEEKLGVVTGFKINSDGSLTLLHTNSGLPTTVVGLAGY
jgi:6-phosphogluconolactonase